MYIISVDEQKCTVCGECVAMCPVEIYKVEDGHLIVGDSSECSYCQSCISVCAPQAITIAEV